jgi:hypothetical protein
MGNAGNLEQTANLEHPVPLTVVLVDLLLHLFSVTFCQVHRLSQQDHLEKVGFFPPVLLKRSVNVPH